MPIKNHFCTLIIRNFESESDFEIDIEIENENLDNDNVDLAGAVGKNSQEESEGDVIIQN